MAMQPWVVTPQWGPMRASRAPHGAQKYFTGRPNIAKCSNTVYGGELVLLNQGRPAIFSNLREFVSANERHPESVRVFPWLRPAAGDSERRERRGSAGKSPKCPLLIAKIDFNLPKKSINFKISI